MLHLHQQPVAGAAMGDVIGLPTDLSSNSLMILFDNGRAVAIAGQRHLTLYTLVQEESRLHASEQSYFELPGTPRALAASALGLLVAVENRERSLLLLAAAKEPVSIMEWPGTITHMVAAGSQAFLVLTYYGHRSSLLQVNLRQRKVVTERFIESGEVELAVDTTGNHLVMTNKANRKVTALGPDLKPMSSGQQTFSYRNSESETYGNTQNLEERDRQKPHYTGCCCVSCASTGQEPTQHPGSDNTTPAQTPEAPGGVHDGDAGLPTGNGGTVVGNGDQVNHHPPYGRGHMPCGRRLFWNVARLQQAGSYFLAADAAARHVAMLSTDMNLLDEWHFGRGGAFLLSTPETPMMLMHLPGIQKWMWRDVHQIVTERRPNLSDFLIPNLDIKTFIGQQTYALSYGQQASPTSIKAIMLPVIEGDQSYSSANLAGFGAFMNRTMVPLVKDYYDENSFGQLKDVNVSVFGVNVGPAGGPIPLPRHKLADYFFPQYMPAQTTLTKNAVNAGSLVKLDGRESLQITAQPLTGGPAGGTLTFPFFALAFVRDEDLYPVSIKFLGTETLDLSVKTPAGASKTLHLTFPVKTIDINDQSEIAAKLGDLTAYLDTIMQAAETGAGIATRLFNAPKATHISQVGKQFGRLLVTFAGTATTGNKLEVNMVSSSLPGGDPMGFTDPILGTLSAGNTFDLNRYFENSALLAQEAAGFGYNGRLLNDPDCQFNAGASTLTTAISISDRYGGPGATVQFVSSSGLESLFDTTASQANSATNKNNAEALRDRSELYQDVFSAAIERLRQANMPTDALKDFGCVLIMPIEPASPSPVNPAAVLPSEMWNVTPLFRPFDFRGAENITTVIDKKDNSIQLQSAWALIFMTGGIPDNPMICHELGHAIGYGDLYKQEGYRDELAYMGSWAMMSWHPPMSHHCGYHKLQSGWIPDGAGTETDFGRVFPLGLPDAAVTRTWELLMVPVELWRDSLIASSRTAFGVGNDIPVVQLAYIDFGGDGSTFGLIEARQPGAKFSQNLPGEGLLITNGISWRIDERYATNTWYRRSLQLLNPNDILHNAGDQFDLARAAELPVKGMKVEVLDRKTVEGDAQVYRIKVSRENAEFIDLYFDRGDPYYKSPDHWVDWMGNNGPNPEQLNPNFQPGEPTDQGEAIRVHPSRPEKHWLVARVRNRGQVKALDVKLNFFYFDPPGAGDSGKPMDPSQINHYKLVGSKTFPEIPGGNDPRNVLLEWDVPSGFSGHTCLLAQIEDYKIPEDATGAALGSEDVWQLNNHCQKNVDKYEALSASPFAPIEFDFSILNAGVGPETAYPEPDGLPYGMKLTVSPSKQTIPADTKALFHCKLELDEKIIRTGCENDQRFRIVAWRQDPESSARWGGVEYEIQPREKTATQLTGTWDYANKVTLKGTVTPNPGGGVVHIRLDFQNQQAVWVSVNSMNDGSFAWSGTAPANSFELETIARFEGNRKFGSSLSNVVKISPPPVIR